MLTLEQLIAEATALPDADKAILIEKVAESMTEQIDHETLLKGVQKAQERIAEIDSGAVQTIPGEVALAQVQAIPPGTLTGLRGIAKRPGPAPSDYTDYLTQKYQ